MPVNSLTGPIYPKIVNLRGLFNLELKLMRSYYLEMLLQNPMLRNESSYHPI